MTDISQTQKPVDNITVLNVHQADPMDLALWCNTNILSIRIPQPGPNTPVSTIIPEITRLLAEIPNRMGLATELYGVVVGHQARLKVAKKTTSEAIDKKQLEGETSLINASFDILYRAIQTLQTQYEAASRMITVMDSNDKMSRR